MQNEICRKNTEDIKNVTYEVMGIKYNIESLSSKIDDVIEDNKSHYNDIFALLKETIDNKNKSEKNTKDKMYKWIDYSFKALLAIAFIVYGINKVF